MRTTMGSARTNARVAGTLFITATVASVVGGPLLADPILHSSSYLSRVSEEQSQVIAGAFGLIVAAFACAGIAVCLYPVLRHYGEGLTLGSVCFRVVEGLLYLVGAVSVLLMVNLSQEFVKAAGPALSQFETTGALLRAVRDRAGLMGSLAFYTGALMYYYLFLRSRLLPSWLSVWGFAGAALGLAAGLLALFRVIEYMSGAHIGLNMPIAVNEMVPAVWLIVRGFASPAVAPGSRLIGTALSSGDGASVPSAAA